MAGAPIGNTNALKMKTPEQKERAYQAYCDHISNGFSKATFVYKSDDFSVSYKTLDKYIEENPIEFPPIHIEFALIESQYYWEKIVKGSAEGTNKDANTASLQMIMRNKFGWDKINQSNDKNEPGFRKATQQIEEE